MSGQTFAEAMAAKAAKKNKGKPAGKAKAAAPAATASATTTGAAAAPASDVKAAPPSKTAAPATTAAATATATAATATATAATAAATAAGGSATQACAATQIPTPVPCGAYSIHDVPRDPWDATYVLNFDVSERAAIRTFFHTFGFVVVRDVLSPADCTASVAEVHAVLERGTGGKWQRHDPATWDVWPDNGLPQYASPSKPPLFGPQFLRNRTNPKVHAAFATLFSGGGADRPDFAKYNDATVTAAADAKGGAAAAGAVVDEPLLVNHDRCCFFRPTSERGSAWSTKANLHLDMNAWAWRGDGAALRKHLDGLDYTTTNQFINENNQASHSDGLQLQAAINLLDNSEADGGFVCVPGFHAEFDAYYGDVKRSGPPRLERANVDYSPKDALQKRAVRVPMRPGSVVVWDQRLPHGSWPNQRTAQPRCAQFLKMFPARLCTPKRAAARAAALQRAIAPACKDPNAGAGGVFALTDLARALFGLPAASAAAGSTASAAAVKK